MLFRSGIAGNIFLPMHIPVLLGGFLLTPIYALLVGMLTPILNSLLTGMPVLFPIAIIMVFELGVYGLAASYFYRKFKMPVILSLILSMMLGRLVAGVLVYILAMAFSTVQMKALPFIQGAITLGLPGIIIQIILIPVIIYAINRYKIIDLN